MCDFEFKTIGNSESQSVGEFWRGQKQEEVEEAIISNFFKFGFRENKLIGTDFEAIRINWPKKWFPKIQRSAKDEAKFDTSYIFALLAFNIFFQFHPQILS